MRICQDINHKKGRIVRGKNELFFIIKVKQFFFGEGEEETIKVIKNDDVEGGVIGC